MLKKSSLIILLFLLPLIAEAGFWDAVGQCFKNPCNCGHGDRIETWDGVSRNKGPENTNCPPWNKDGGREGCLLQFDYPGYPGFLLYRCAEETAENNYFSPKIRIRSQSCNLFACWTKETSLNWDGDCVVWPTAYGLPLLRICARIALGPDSVKNFPPDDGYTPGVHLNFEGATKPDPVILNSDGTQSVMVKPKLCAYEDPSMLDVVNVNGINIDLMDFNPKKQTMHVGSGIHPIAKVLIFLVENMVDSGTSLGDMLGMVFDSISPVSSIAGIKFFQIIFDAIDKIIKFIGDIIIALLKEFGQFNRVVNSHLGCVEVPLGPYPPPYCPILKPFKPIPVVQEICKTDVNGVLAKSTYDNICVRSKLVNNYIRNAIRVGFDNLVPICQNQENPMLTDKCVGLNLGALASASAINTATLGRGAIKPCGSAPCINTIIPFTCSVSNNGCEDGYRIVYGITQGKTTSPLPAYRDDLPDCSGSVNNNCQVIWGINTGEFLDTQLLFPQVEYSYNSSPLISSFTLRDSSGASRMFQTSIVRQSTFLSNVSSNQGSGNTGFQQTPSQICALELGANKIVGCTNRDLPMRPVVYSCGAIDGINCINDYFAPKLIAEIKYGNDVTRGIAAPKTVVDGSYSVNYKVNLAGYDFTSFVTDETFTMKPFSGSKSVNPVSIYGNYRNNLAPYDGSGNSTGAVYLTGLEYINDNYNVGGKFVCLQTDTIEKCPVNVKNCVLTNLNNNNIVNCKDFLTAATTKYPSLRLCQSTDSNCSPIDSLPAKDGSNGGITINKCSSNGNQNTYCYTNQNNIEVCKVSLSPKDRNTPAASLGDTLADSQYYDPNSVQPSISSITAQITTSSTSTQTTATQTTSNQIAGYNFDMSTTALRDKTPVELGLCAPIPQPVCSTITENGAIWPGPANIAQEVTGSCLDGYIPINPSIPLKRFCLAFPEARKVGFEALAPGVGCKVKPPLCPALTDPSQDNGFATWPSVEAGIRATGICTYGYSTLSGNPPSRLCFGDGKWSPMDTNDNVGCAKCGVSIKTDAQYYDPSVDSIISDTRLGSGSMFRIGNIIAYSIGHDFTSPNTYPSSLKNQMVFLRFNINVSNLNALTTLSLKIKYEDFLFLRKNATYVNTNANTVKNTFLDKNYNSGDILYDDLHNKDGSLKSYNPSKSQEPIFDLMPHLQEGDNLFYVAVRTVEDGGLLLSIVGIQNCGQ